MKYSYALILVAIAVLAKMAIRSEPKYQTGVMITYKGIYCTIIDRKSLLYRWSYKLQDISGNMIGWVSEEELDGI